ncbi:MAG TPA: hypothetical protein VNN17_09590, partial [Terriglobia bacterium]|nr:hypothetical protein [Terriglobia bacterium]
QTRLPERVEPRLFAAAIARATGAETVVNRVTVHASFAEQRNWLCETYHRYGIRDLILVGGESQQVTYCGPGVVETASIVAEEGLPYLLGGITIPHRPKEAARVRDKARHGIRFFTTQVLLDAKDVVALLQQLEGLNVRVLLSFTPVSHPRDLQFLEWLGVELPPKFVREIQQASGPEAAVEISFALARRILEEVFRSLPPGAPAVGLQIERITKRNSASALRMLAELGEFYRTLLRNRYPKEGGAAPAAPDRRQRSRSLESRQQP